MEKLITYDMALRATQKLAEKKGYFKVIEDEICTKYSDKPEYNQFDYSRSRNTINVYTDKRKRICIWTNTYIGENNRLQGFVIYIKEGRIYDAHVFDKRRNYAIEDMGFVLQALYM